MSDANVPVCGQCGKGLNDDEIREPIDRGSGNLCAACDIEHYWECEFCCELVDEEYHAEVFAVFDEDAAGVPIGMYAILDRPFYTQALIGWGWIHKDRVRRVSDIPEGKTKEGSPCAMICQSCAKPFFGGIVMNTPTQITSIIARAFPNAADHPDAYIKAHGFTRRGDEWAHFTDGPSAVSMSQDGAIMGLQEFDRMVTYARLSGHVTPRPELLQSIANMYQWRVAHPDRDEDEIDGDEIESWAAANVGDVF